MTFQKNLWAYFHQAALNEEVIKIWDREKENICNYSSLK
mgnify:CR=1 FL=1